MPPASSVSTRSVNFASRSASQSRAGWIASRPWLEMLGKEQSSFSSSTNRAEFFSMYASTALVEITLPSYPCPDERGSGGVSLLAAGEPRLGNQLASLVARGFRRGPPNRSSDSAFDLGRVVPLVPRDGRDDVLASRRDRHHQPRVRAGASRQRRPARY